MIQTYEETLNLIRLRCMQIKTTLKHNFPPISKNPKQRYSVGLTEEKQVLTCTASGRVNYYNSYGEQFCTIYQNYKYILYLTKQFHFLIYIYIFYYSTFKNNSTSILLVQGQYKYPSLVRERLNTYLCDGILCSCTQKKEGNTVQTDMERVLCFINKEESVQ